MLLLVTGAWLSLHRARESRWLQVEAPRHAVPERSLPLRVTLHSPPRDGWLIVDLHGLSARREPLGFLVHAGSQRTDREIWTYEFDTPVVAKAELGYVLAIVYLSPSGHWQDRIATAATEPIPIRRSGEAGELQPVPTYDPQPWIVPEQDPSLALRASIGVLWLLSGILVWRTGSQGLALACVAAGLWELSGMEARLLGVARSLAREHRLYYERHALQELVTFAVLLGAAAFAAWRLRSMRARGSDALKAALGLYAVLSLASLSSWHEADRLLAAPVLSIPLVQLAQLATALVALVLARRTQRA